jgi:uncharacterized protein YukE
MLAGSAIDNQAEQLAEDWSGRLTAFYGAVDSGWELAARQVEEKFQSTFGEALQRLAAEVEQEKARLAAPKQRPALTKVGGTSVENPRRRLWPWLVATCAACAIGVGGFWVHQTRSSAAVVRQLVVPASLAVRSGPAESFPKVASPAVDAAYEVVDDSVPGWTKVRAQGGTVGWVQVTVAR